MLPFACEFPCPLLFGRFTKEARAESWASAPLPPCLPPQKRELARGQGKPPSVRREYAEDHRSTPKGGPGVVGAVLPKGLPASVRANSAIFKVRDFACYCGSKYVPSMLNLRGILVFGLYGALYDQKHENDVDHFFLNAHFNHRAHASSALAVYERVCDSCRPHFARRGTWSTRDAAQMANF